MKKKILLSLLACTILLALCGCGKPKDDGSLSSNWEDMQFMMNEARYDLPCDIMSMNDIIEIDISENMDMSFGAIADSATMVDANSTTTALGHFKDSDFLVTLTVVNNTDKAKELKNCKLVGITMKAGISYDKLNSEWSSDAPNILVAGGGKFGMKLDDIISIYGEPAINETFENKRGVTGNVYYTVSSQNAVVKYLRFGIYKNILNEIELMCEELVIE